MLVGREIPIAPDPVGIARAFLSGGLPGVALLHAAVRSPDPFARWSFVAAEPDRTSQRLDPFVDDDDPGTFAGVDFTPEVPRWIGVVPYECRRDLERPEASSHDRRPEPAVSRPAWRRYPAVVCVDHDEGRVLVVGTRLCADRLAERLQRIGHVLAAPAPHVEIADVEPLAHHAERIVLAKELIVRGDIYQVNLARKVRVLFRESEPSRGAASAAMLELYARLIAAAPTPFGAFIDLGGGITVLSTSPELLLRAETRAGSTRFTTLRTCPIKGTRPRGADAVDDAELASELDADPKERAELWMIVDVERNDLGRVAETGSVRLASAPRVVTHRTVHHRQALLVARARGDVTREDVLSAMVPSGSVTGAPKVRAMEVIAALEPHRRGLYTGGIGYVAHDGSVTLSMAIRTLVATGREGEYLTGGGIVADSDPGREVEETQWKALQLARVAEGGVA